MDYTDLSVDELEDKLHELTVQRKELREEARKVTAARDKILIADLEERRSRGVSVTNADQLKPETPGKPDKKEK